MKKLLSTVCTVAMLALLNSAHAMPMLSLEPSSQMAMPGDTVSLDLVISGLDSGGPDSLGDFDIDIGYDTGAISLVGFSLGSLLGDIGLFEAFDFSGGDLGGGIINIAEVSFLLPSELDALQPDSFALATFEFMVDVLPVGSSTMVGFDTIWALGDGFGDPLDLVSATGAVISNGSMEVPVPPTLVLMLMGLALFRCRQRRGA